MKKTASRHIIVKLLKSVIKKKNLTLARGKNTRLDRGKGNHIFCLKKLLVKNSAITFLSTEMRHKTVNLEFFLFR